MGIINVLDYQVANLIAAGEVVDRPASVVKELLENAIDAQADAVTVEIKRGGASFIRITDNGCGMAKEDVPIALKRHATSKIKNAADLDSIMTLGFRGEALAAISSVSEMRILTKREADAVGTVLEASGGRVTSIADAGCPDGTTIIVKDLFFNTPARRKFLKKDGTEATGVASYVEKIALSHPEITIRFISDGELKYATAGDNNRYSSIYAVLGRDFAKKSLEIAGGFDGVNVTGYIGTPELVRGNRNLQIFFINSRYIRSKTVAAALEQAFSTYIPADKFPCAVLYLDINPSLVDVNVHPAKLEVKFSNERTVFESVYYAVRGALENHLTRPELKFAKEAKKAKKLQETTHGFVPVKEGRGGEAAPSVKKMRRTIEDGIAAETILLQKEAAPREQMTADLQNSEKTQTAPPDFLEDLPPLPDAAPPEIPVIEPDISIEPVQDPLPTKGKDKDIPLKLQSTEDSVFSYMKLPPLPNQTADTQPSIKSNEQAEHEMQPGSDQEAVLQKNMQVVPPYRIVGEVFQCYVILECENTMYLVDKHAAHERIIFEQLKAFGTSDTHQAQILLMPLSIMLTLEEADAAKQYQEELFSSGFQFLLHGREADLTQIPSFLDTAQAKDAFLEACARLADHTGNAALTEQNRYEHALFQASCKAAVKAGRNYDTAHLQWICDRVLSDPEIRYCPHGRPVCFEVTKAMIENRFKRT